MFPLLVLLVCLLMAWLPARLSWYLWTKRLQFSFADWFMATFALGVVLALVSQMAAR